MRARFAFLTALAAVLWLAPAASRQAPAGDALVLVTLDGARVEEMFGGLDPDVLRSTLQDRERMEDQAVYRRFWADTPEERRERLMPFFWRTLMTRHGSIAGNPRLESAVTLTNGHRFSYPGYAEILLGEAHDEMIASNDPVQNPYATVLEELARHLGLPPPGAAVFASWSVFNQIAERTPGTLTINAGFERFDEADERARLLGDLQFETPTPWDSVRHDVYTFRLAMAHLKTARPRILYLALGETDDWAHDGRYDRVLDAYARTDRWLEELWTWIDTQPDYTGRTHMLITTDHGRGRTMDDWRHHGKNVDGAQDVWMAFITPSMARRGEWRSHDRLHTNQVAATMAQWMNMSWNDMRPRAGLRVR